MKRMPTLFVGHGSPMMALEHTEITNTFQTIGKNIINKYLSPKEMYQLGTKLQVLRDEGYLIMGSGNIVHNLRCLEWENPSGSPATIEFDQYISNAVLENDVNTVINYSNHSQASYAVPTPDHYLPLIYIMGASESAKPTVFNQTYNSGSLSMTGFIFEDAE